MITAIILAGGRGTRLQSVISEVPKPMAPIHGRPFLEYQLDYWIKQGVSKIILAIGYKANIIQNHFGESYRGIPIQYSVEQEPLGTGGGLRLAVENLDAEYCLLLNGDTFFDVNLDDLLSFHINNNADWTFSLFKTEDTKRYMGMEICEDGRVQELQVESKENACLANGGVYVFRPDIIKNPSFKRTNIHRMDLFISKWFANNGNRFGAVVFHICS